MNDKNLPAQDTMHDFLSGSTFAILLSIVGVYPSTQVKIAAGIVAALLATYKVSHDQFQRR